MRTGDCPVPFAAPASSQLSVGPLPIVAWTSGTPVNFFRLNWDQFIVIEPHAAANWTGRRGGVAWHAVGVAQNHNNCAGGLVFDGPDPGPDVINYAATPADVHALDDGAPAAPVIDYPCLPL